MTSDSELYNDIVEMLSNGSFLQLNGKPISLTELNEYINAQQEEIERLNNVIKKAIEFIYENAYDVERENCIDDLWGEIPKLLEILKGEDKE